jgi:hypothetical protein
MAHTKSEQEKPWQLWRLQLLLMASLLTAGETGMELKNLPGTKPQMALPELQ